MEPNLSIFFCLFEILFRIINDFFKNYSFIVASFFFRNKEKRKSRILISTYVIQYRRADAPLNIEYL